MKIFVANWKMNLPYKQELTFFQNKLEEIKDIPNKLVVCPSFPSLAPLAQLFKDTEIALGAQTCSAFEPGAHTGEVLAQSLVQIGCSYVLVGHSEQRAQGITSEEVAQQAQRVLEAGMIPIICIGEHKDAKEKGATKEVLFAQLDPIKEMLDKTPAYIAYEPVWSIGTGETPSLNELSELFSWLKSELPTCAYFYGGSIDQNNVDKLKTLNHVVGFLVGGASLDFQQLKKIVS